MILADKIMNERKRNGWSQEELAQQLGVSRQSVSKWEGAQSVPDINRILQMAELFGVTTDYLLKDEMKDEMEEDWVKEKTEKETVRESVKLNEKVQNVTMEDACDFLELRKKNAPKIAMGVSLCVASPIPLIVLSGFADSHLFGITENMAGGIGVLTLLFMVAISVFMFINCGTKSKKYEYLDTKAIETAYGVDGMVREKKNAFEAKSNLAISIGVMLCIMSCVPLLISSFLAGKDYVITGMVGVLLLFVSVAVNLFVRVGIINESFDKLLQEGDYTKSNKKATPIIDRISGTYWLLATAIYLGWSFSTNQWNISWIMWPVAGVLFAAVITVVKIIMKVED